MSDHAATQLGPARRSWLRLISLSRDQASPEAIDDSVRDNARLGGTNLWVLLFAIVIASVGLNVNSTAVIIGAMLISPLMGPIIAIGYGAGVHDHALIRQSLKHLAVFVGISLAGSTTYFALSPLTAAHSELLARTSPTIWDVLIAFFGGAAGMVGLTRKEKSTLIPGVAIATALMPPLCTAGYGLASRHPQFFVGAFYLFLINSVFIALATLLIVRVLRLPMRASPDAAARRRGSVLFALAVTATLVPSVILAWRLVGEELFIARAERFVQAMARTPGNTLLVSHEVDARARAVTLTLLGSGTTPVTEAGYRARLAEFGLADATLRIQQPAEAKLPDFNRMQREMQKSLERDVLAQAMRAVEAQGTRIAALERELEAERTRRSAARPPSGVDEEIRALWPELKQIAVTQGAGGAGPTQVLVAVEPLRRMSAAEEQRLRRWLKARWPDADVRLAIGKLGT